jgi:hypothetical protein
VNFGTNLVKNGINTSKGTDYNVANKKFNILVIGICYYDTDNAKLQPVASICVELRYMGNCSVFYIHC